MFDRVELPAVDDDGVGIERAVVDGVAGQGIEAGLQLLVRPPAMALGEVYVEQIGPCFAAAVQRLAEAGLDVGAPRSGASSIHTASCTSAPPSSPTCRLTRSRW